MFNAEVLHAPTAFQELPKKKIFEDYTDNHMHIDPINGEGLVAVEKFEKAGGRFLFLICKTTKDWNLDLNEEGLWKLSENTVKLSKKINRETNVRSFPVIGIHPAEFVSMCQHMSIQTALETAKKVLDRCGEMVQSGEAIALGEVGRPHFEVEEDILKACNELLLYAMEIASDINCAVQLHTESSTARHFEEFREMALKANLDPSKVIKHYSPPLVKTGEITGIFPSLIASQENIKTAIREGNRFLMESDYIDDRKRPGAVVGPKSVPRVSRLLFERGILDEEDLWRIHKENIEKIYGINLD
jgi:TatD-related deoxyribonuclease